MLEISKQKNPEANSQFARIRLTYKYTLVICIALSLVNIPLLTKSYLNRYPLILSIFYALGCSALLAFRNREWGRNNYQARIIFVYLTILYIGIRIMMADPRVHINYYVFPAIAVSFSLLTDVYLFGIIATLAGAALFIMTEFFTQAGWSVIAPVAARDIYLAARSNTIGSIITFAVLIILAYQAFSRSENALEKAKREAEDFLAGIRNDLIMAQRVQNAVMPAMQLEFASAKIRFWIKPMQEVGGDFYRCSETADGRIRIFFGDAMGHGIQAALITMAILSEYDASAEPQKTPAEVLMKINENFYRKFRDINTYATCMLIHFNPTDNTIMFASAGHPVQYLVRRGEIIEFGDPGLPIGILPNIEYRNRKMHFEITSDELILFTDGITEGNNRRGEMFGETRLRNAVLASAGNGGQACFAAYREFTEGMEQQDDVMVISFSAIQSPRSRPAQALLLN